MLVPWLASADGSPFDLTDEANTGRRIGAILDRMRGGKTGRLAVRPGVAGGGVPMPGSPAATGPSRAARSLRGRAG